PRVVLVQFRQITLVPIAARAAGEAPALRQRDLLLRRYLVRRPERLATRIVPAVEALQAHEQRRAELFIAPFQAVVCAMPRVLDGERRDDLRDVGIVAPTPDLGVFGILPRDWKEPAHGPRRAIDLHWVAVGVR